MGAVTECASLKKTVEEILQLPKEALIKEILIAYPADRVTPACSAALREVACKKTFQGIEIKVIPQKTPRMGFFSDLTEIASGTHCVLFSSDGAMPVSLIGQMVALEKENPDSIVSSSRWLKANSFEGYNRIKLIVNRLAQAYLRVLFRTKLTDLTNAVQIVPTELMQKIRWEETNFSRGMEMVLKPLKLGVPIIEIPTDYTGRSEGRSNNSCFELLFYLIASIKIRFMRKKRILKDVL